MPDKIIPHWIDGHTVEGTDRRAEVTTLPPA
jgi:hypothetical protein